MKRLWVVFGCVCAGILGLFLLATPLHAAGLDDPTSTPMPTPAVTPLPYHGVMTTTTFEWSNFMSFTPTHPVSLSIDLGLWDYENLVSIVRIAKTAMGLGYTGYLLDIAFVIGIGLFAVPPIMIFAKQVGAARDRIRERRGD